MELIENFVAQLVLNRFLLVGGSMGGLALLYAERNPSKIAGFVNVEGNLAPEDCMFSRKAIRHSYSDFLYFEIQNFAFEGEFYEG